MGGSTPVVDYSLLISVPTNAGLDVGEGAPVNPKQDWWGSCHLVLGTSFCIG